MSSRSQSLFNFAEPRPFVARDLDICRIRGAGLGVILGDKNMKNDKVIIAKVNAALAQDDGNWADNLPAGVACDSERAGDTDYIGTLTDGREVIAVHGNPYTKCAISENIFYNAVWIDIDQKYMVKIKTKYFYSDDGTEWVDSKGKFAMTDAFRNASIRLVGGPQDGAVIA